MTAVPDLLVALTTYTAVAFTAESLFTGVTDAARSFLAGRRIDGALPCRTFLWTVPVYGLSALAWFAALDAWLPALYAQHWAIRGATYACAIFAFEWWWGFALERTTGTCPWTYRPSPHATLRYIKPEYAPFWFGFGLVLEALHLRVIPALTAL